MGDHWRRVLVIIGNKKPFPKTPPASDWREKRECEEEAENNLRNPSHSEIVRLFIWQSERDGAMERGALLFKSLNETGGKALETTMVVLGIGEA